MPAPEGLPEVLYNTWRNQLADPAGMPTWDRLVPEWRQKWRQKWIEVASVATAHLDANLARRIEEKMLEGGSDAKPR